MLTYADINADKKAVVFGLDDVLFPKKDYLLQVYYLFARFLEYTETVPPADDLTDFLKTAYEHHGEGGLFERAAAVFGINKTYQESFDRLHITARLPLKLLMFKPVSAFMHELHGQGKQLFVLADGKPAVQLNKLRHVEWNGLDSVLKVYFNEELLARQVKPLDFLLSDNELNINDVFYVGKSSDLAYKWFAECIEAKHFHGPLAETGN